VAKRGRPRGTGGPTHWSRNPANAAAQHASVLIELWLAGRSERRYTVPKAIKLKLCELAIAHVMALQRPMEDMRPQIEASLQRITSKTEAELRERGWTHEEIAAWSKKRSERARKRSKKEFKKPSVDQVFEIVTRRAPAITLRRKARSPCR
jgi:hypothetical protein